MNKTEQSNSTIEFENGERIYSCRCGIHRGDYAQEDWEMHQCLHETDLLGLSAGKNSVQAICPDCGKSFKINMEVRNVK